MEIEILDYIDDARGMRKGFVDIKVIYSAEKSECFRGLGLFEKENRKWLTFPNCKRGDKWLPYYERFPVINKEIFSLALNALESHLANPPVVDKSDDLPF